MESDPATEATFIENEHKITLKILNDWQFMIVAQQVNSSTAYQHNNSKLLNTVKEYYDVLKAAITEKQCKILQLDEKIQLEFTIVLTGGVKRTLSFLLKTQRDPEKQIQPKAQLHKFKFSSTMKSETIELGEENRTAVKVSQATWQLVVGDTPLPPKGKHKFTICLRRCTSFLFIIGVTLSRYLNIKSSGAYLFSTSWMYSSYNGMKHSGGKATKYGKPVTSVGTLITTIVDMDKLIIKFKVGEESMGEAYKMDILTEKEMCDIYPVIDLYGLSDAVSIVE